MKGSIHPRLRLDIWHLVGHREAVHRTVIDRHRAGIGVDRGQRMFHPVDVIARGKIFPRMGAADSVRRAAPSMVTTAWTMRLSNSKVSMRSEFQINERSVTEIWSLAAQTSWISVEPSSRSRPSAIDRAMALHHLLHPEPQLGGRKFALGMAEAVEAGKRLVGGTCRKLRLFGARRREFPARKPAARPKTMMSMSEFEPSLLAPWTETQAASPIARRPGTTASGSPSFLMTTSP